MSNPLVQAWNTCNVQDRVDFLIVLCRLFRANVEQTLAATTPKSPEREKDRDRG